jgi:SAM-dependent methyltransferase
MSASSTFNAADAESYERLMGRWSRRLAKPFLDLAGTRDGEQVLDVGCGTGALVAELRPRIPRGVITGIDLSRVYVEHAQRVHAATNVHFEMGDACALRFPDRSFDRVFSLLVLHFVPRPETAVHEMKRVARPGATVAATVWDIRGGYVANRMLFDTAAALDPNANDRRAGNFTRPMTRPGELGNAWRAAGFADVVETALTIRMEFASFDDYWGPYGGKDGPVAQYLATLEQAARSRLKDAVRAAYLDGEPDGPRSYAAVAWAVKGIA